MRITISLAIVVLILIAASLSTVGSQEKASYKPTGSESTITGTISFDGVPPKPIRIDTSADPVCTELEPYLKTEWVVVANQKLANVMVYVRGEALNLYSFAAPSTGVTLEHKRCRYVPRVMGMQAQQTLKILNGDPTVHNTHATPRLNREWNQSQPPGSDALEQRWTSPEPFIPIKDNQHPWEKAYVGVFSHPFFAVTTKDGSYRISGLPPGQYTVVVRHEVLGEKTAEVFLGGGELKTLDFTFKDSDRPAWMR